MEWVKMPKGQFQFDLFPAVTYRIRDLQLSANYVQFSLVFEVSQNLLFISQAPYAYGIKPFQINVTFVSKYLRMDQLKFMEDSLWKIWRDMVCLGKFF